MKRDNIFILILIIWFLIKNISIISEKYNLIRILIEDYIFHDVEIEYFFIIIKYPFSILKNQFIFLNITYGDVVISIGFYFIISVIDNVSELNNFYRNIMIQEKNLFAG